MFTGMKQARKYFLLALGVILLDQLVKLVVKFNMEKGMQGQIKVLGDLFKLHFIENNGAAFGMTVTSLTQGVGLDLSEETGKLILSLFSIGAMVAIGVVLYRMAGHKSPLPWFMALIFGGALGNIIDRTFYGAWFHEVNDYDGGLFHGQVVDMFYFDLWEGQLPHWLPLVGGDYTSMFPIFNIADAGISIGIVVILIFQGRFFKMDEMANAPATPKPVEATGELPPTSTSTATPPPPSDSAA
jgi:signal peptidase II